MTTAVSEALSYEVEHREYVPPEMGGEQSSEQALDYTYIPAPPERGFLDPANIPALSSAYLRGLGKAAQSIKEHVTGNHSDAEHPHPERKIIPVQAHDRLVLKTEPIEGNPEDARNEVLSPGLTEMDIGSALMLHKAIARLHPDRRIITIPTLGVSMSGQLLSIRDGYQRSLEETATDNLELLKHVVQNGRVNMKGVSLGSYMTMMMAQINAAANPSDSLNLYGLDLISPAVGAKNIPAADKFRAEDASDKDFVNDVTGRFFAHMPGTSIRMALNHPEEAGECLSVVGGYALHLNKLPFRLAAIIGNLRGVQQGIEWDDILSVARTYDIHVLGGELDPIYVETFPQWMTVKKYEPRTLVAMWQNHGHALSLDSDGTAKHLADMEQEPHLALAS